MGRMPSTMVADVFHRPRSRLAVRHRAVLGTRLPHLHARRRDPRDAARDLERCRVSGVSRCSYWRRPAKAVPGLWPAMEPLGVAVVIPVLNEGASIAAVIGEIPRDVVREIIVVDGGSSDGTAEIAAAAGARVIQTLC